VGATLIDLRQYRIKTGFRIDDVQFPQVYRLMGYYAKQPLPPEASRRQSPLCYTLSPNETNGLLNTTVEPVRTLNPEIDSGWVIVRHHTTLRSAHGYLDAILDHESESSKPTTSALYQTRRGLFTLLHRKQTRGLQNHLLIYTTKSYAGFPEGEEIVRIVHPDGNVTEDTSILTHTRVIFVP